MIVIPIAPVTVTAVTLAPLGCISGAWIGRAWANGPERTRQWAATTALAPDPGDRFNRGDSAERLA